MASCTVQADFPVKYSGLMCYAELHDNGVQIVVDNIQLKGEQNVFVCTGGLQFQFLQSPMKIVTFPHSLS